MKLVMLACVSAGMALALACVGFAWNGIHTLREAKIRALRDRAEIIAFQCGPTVVLRDATRGEGLLASLRSDPTIETARIYDKDMKLVASWGRKLRGVPSVSLAEGYRFVGFRHIELLQPVIISDRRVGAVFLRANTSDLHIAVWDFGRIAIYLSGVAMCVAFFFSMRFQRGISRPLVTLKRAADRITRFGDYSIRVPVEGGRELRTLHGAFNGMLDQIQSSEALLQSAQNQLEVRVVERTKELSEEICRRREAQSNLEMAKEAAESANRAKTEFLANMSHEIRTPLNGIMGFTDILLAGGNLSNEETHEYLATIRTSGSHLLSLINDILDLSKIEVGKFDVERIACSPHRIVSEVVDVLRVRAQEKGLYLEYEWASPVPEQIESDPARLRQLLINLVGNAIKFTEKGGVRIKLGLTELAPQRLQIQVVDTGIGIPDDKLEIVFNPFSQADTSVTRRFGGTGLGLAISRNIADALGGGLSVESQLGKGSVFTCIVDPGTLSKVKMLESPPPEDEPEEQQATEPAPAALPDATILVVDDGDTNRKLVQLILRRAGAKVETAENGLEAVQLASGQRFDLILMDMQMPVLDGYSATRKLRQLGSTVPIIALTAHAMKGDQEKCMEAGCTGFLTKPVEANRLLHEVGEAIGMNPGSAAPAALNPYATETQPAPTESQPAPVTPAPVEAIPPQPQAPPMNIYDSLPPSAPLPSTPPVAQPAPTPPAPAPSAPAPSTPAPASPAPAPAPPAADPIYSSLPMDDEDFREIVEEFIERLATQLTQMSEARARGDFAELAQLAHWLKGAGGTAGFPAFTEPAKMLELAAKDGRDDACGHCFAQLQSIANRLAMPELAGV